MGKLRLPEWLWLPRWLPESVGRAGARILDLTDQRAFHGRRFHRLLCLQITHIQSSLNFLGQSQDFGPCGFLLTSGDSGRRQGCCWQVWGPPPWGVTTRPLMTSEESQGHRACGARVQFTEHFLFDEEEACVCVRVCVCLPCRGVWCGVGEQSIQEFPKNRFPKGGTIPYISFPRTLARGPELVLLYKAEPTQQTN